ncbi:MAG: hypothetical protein ACKV22_31140 [Bryobacteraceae bacterium]
MLLILKKLPEKKKVQRRVNALSANRDVTKEESEAIEKTRRLAGNAHIYWSNLLQRTNLLN